jgi:hypothetical protein
MNNDEETHQKLMDEATKEGLALTRTLFNKGSGSVHKAALILGASVGSAFGAMYTADEKDVAKEWLTAFFITMTAGLRESMGIDLSVNWTVKDKEE